MKPEAIEGEDISTSVSSSVVQSMSDKAGDPTRVVPDLVEEELVEEDLIEE